MEKGAKLSRVCSTWRLATFKLYTAVIMWFRLVISSAFLCYRRRQQSGTISTKIGAKTNLVEKAFAYFVVYFFMFFKRKVRLLVLIDQQCRYLSIYRLG